MLCNNCGNSVGPELNFCDQCGRAISQPAQSSTQVYGSPAPVVADAPQRDGTETYGYGPPPAPTVPMSYDEFAPRGLKLDGEISRKNPAPFIIAGLVGLLVIGTAIAFFIKTRSNKPPNLQTIEAAPAGAHIGESVRLTARATDINNDSLSYQWVVSSGRIVGEGETVALDTSGVDISSGRAEVLVKLTVSDGRGGTVSADKTITVLPSVQLVGTVAANAPLIVNLDADQRQITEGESVNLSAQVQNRDPSDLTFDWKTSAGILYSNGQTATLQTSGLQLGGKSRQIAVTVTVKDSTGVSQADTQTITLMSAATTNWPPTVKIKANRSSVQQGEDLEITAEANDRDGDAINYSWRVSRGQIVGSGARVTLKTSTVSPGPVEIIATVTDGRGESSADSLTAQVMPPPNHSPSVTSLSANRTSLRAGETVYLTVRATDPDGDTLTYSWSASAGTIRPSGQTARFDTVGVNASAATVSVTVRDQRGGEASESASFSITAEREQGPDPEPRLPTGGVRRAGPISVALQPEDSETFIAVLSGNPGTPQSSSGTIEITVMPNGSGVARGYFPATLCQFDVASKENVSQVSIAGTPGPNNDYSRMRVRMRSKNSSKPARVVISWVTR